VRADEMPYTTPNGCVYDSGDYARCLDMALELIDYERVKEQRGERDGKLVGIGIGSTLDSGTNNFGQSTLLNPELQFSGNNEVATIKLDIFGEIVLTLGTVPQGQGHETTAAMVAADILGCSPDDVHVRAGHDSYWNSHAGFSGTYASQFAVSGLEAVKGATEKLALEIRRLAAAVLGAASPDEIVLEGKQARLKDNPEAALPFMACGAIVNANNAVLPPDARDITLNCRFVYVPPFELPDSDYPLWVTTGRIVYHFHTRTKTGRSKELRDVAPDAFVQLNAADARRYDIADGDMVEVESRRGKVVVPAKVGDIRTEGLAVFCRALLNANEFVTVD